MIYVSKEVAANDGVGPGQRKLSRSDIWKGLVMKAENALPLRMQMPEEVVEPVVHSMAQVVSLSSVISAVPV